MLTTLAVHGYRSLREVALRLGQLTVVTGPNGSGKSSLYSALHLMADTASGQMIATLARSGGFGSVLWAGPEVVSRSMRLGEAPIQGTASRRGPVSLMLGFTTDELGYLIDVGLPPRSQQTLFSGDPEIKREWIWSGQTPRPASLLVKRKNRSLLVRGEEWYELTDSLDQRASVLSEVADPERTPEVMAVRREVRGWRFHDSFRTDAAAPARQPHVGTWTPVMAHDGSDFVAALATILESAYADDLAAAVEAAFPGGRVDIAEVGGRLELAFRQRGLLRSLSAAELSDGTLRYLLLATSLLSPRPPSLLVLNEPETSLHPDVLPGVVELLSRAARRTQVLVVSHSAAIVDALPATDHDDRSPQRRAPGVMPGVTVVHHELEKDAGETRVVGQGILTRPPWEWGAR